MKKEFSFTKDYTEMMKGIAILLMLFHHLFAFPEWYVDGISYIGIPLRANTLEYAIGQFGHICVSIFAFITGYGMFFSYQKGSILKKSFKKGVSFLICYWLILFGLAIPINLALGKTDITLRLIVQNMFTYDHTLVSFAWYVRFYLAMLITLPIFYGMLTKYTFVTIPVFLLLPATANYFLGTVSSDKFIIVKGVYFAMEYFLWITPALMGLCFARYNLFEKLGKLFSKLKQGELFVCLGLMLILMYLRAYKDDTIGINFSFDSVYAPVFIFLACRILSILPSFIHRFLKLMGKHSMNIWFIHSLFFFRTAELMKYAYAPKISILIIIWVIAICLILSFGLTAVSDFVLRNKKVMTIEKTPNKV